MHSVSGLQNVYRFELDLTRVGCRCMVGSTDVGFPGTLPALLDGTQEKSNIVRLRSITAMMLALLLWDHTSFDG